jgi:hypothetical protein
LREKFDKGKEEKTGKMLTKKEEERSREYRSQCCGSGIQCFLDPWIREKFFPDHRSRIQPIFLRA